MKLTAEEALLGMRRRLPDGARVYVPGCAGEPLLFTEAFRAAPQLAAGVTFAGVWIPGINRTDYAALHPEARAETIFLSADRRETFEAGRTRFLPLSYSQAWNWLSETPLDAALVQTSPPDRRGEVSLGVAADFSLAVLARKDILKIAHFNPLMPAPLFSPKVPVETFQAVIENAHPLLQAPASAPTPVFTAIAERIAGFIEDGSTVQFGLGNVQFATLKALTAKRRLHIHSGMISDPLLEAVEAGAIAESMGAVTAGAALGTYKLYDWCGRDKRLKMAPVSETHAHRTLADIDRFVAVNSVIEVDLLGQANAEFIGGRQVSGGGGLIDFLRGAAASKGGRPIVALASTAQEGAVSRITPRLSAPAATLARGDVAIVVTEHGAADLRGLSIEARAEKLIGIADPKFRPMLADAWRDIRREL